MRDFSLSISSLLTTQNSTQETLEEEQRRKRINIYHSLLTSSFTREHSILTSALRNVLQCAALNQFYCKKRDLSDTISIFVILLSLPHIFPKLFGQRLRILGSFFDKQVLCPCTVDVISVAYHVVYAVNNGFRMPTSLK